MTTLLYACNSLPTCSPALALAVQFVGHLARELEQLSAQSASFEAKFGAGAYKTAIANWESKLARARAGEQRWVLITARKKA